LLLDEDCAYHGVSRLDLGPGTIMARLIAVCLVALLPSAAPPDAKPLVLRWHGQSFFDVTTTRGTRVVFDPHAIEAYGRTSVGGDLILVSHFHNDHTQVEVVENRDKARILTGLKVEGRKVDWNSIDLQFRDVHVRAVGVYHDDREGMERGKNAVFVVEADGLRFVHLGDLGHTLTDEQAKQIGPVDVLMIPVGGVYTINGADAKTVVEQLKPRRYIIPMHYGTKVFEELMPATEFLEDQERAEVKRFESNQLTIDPAQKPARPVIAVLNWK
jgi:L-ascorbate metabolism protein UlaG (beta-lactamase superfamily)